jgi:phospholipid transport system substrate-binding protein
MFLKVPDQKITLNLMRGDTGDGDAEVCSEVVPPRGEPIQLNYRLEKTPSGWRIYDVNVLGPWLVETNKSSFNAEIGIGEFGGLIKARSDKNKKRAASVARTSQPS